MMKQRSTHCRQTVRKTTNDMNDRYHWYIFHKGQVLLRRVDDTSEIPYSEEPPLPHPSTAVHSLTMPDHETVKTCEVEEGQLPCSDYEWCMLRQSFHRLSRTNYDKAGKCSEILYWDRTTRYCGLCGGMMHMHTEISKKCERCGNEIWPQISPAVICLIRRGEKVLLVRARNFRGNYYGLVAGFVETGESLEQAMAREIREETGLEVSNLRYFGSQPWPYPCGLMVGFTADYASGELHLQYEELDRGGWFTRESMPAIPERMSIARRLIDSWLGEE